MNPQIDKLEFEALLFATKAHGTQARKYTFEPYIRHPGNVADLVRRVEHTPEMLAAAWLHDTVEDTDATLDDIYKNFGKGVADLVYWLTNASKASDGNRAARKAIDREHIAKAPPAAKTIKLADVFDNARSIFARDPGFSQIYLREKVLLLPVLKEGDPTLFGKAQELVQAYGHML